ncbi:type II TA system antitoxin MqsA family protein [Ruminococcus sp. 5_1_39BFAA]|uniref:type II TA system antitoxin MqsA family protein n=1 Tax=Ruminococcus sp. 5_1_39BFAA TaxID=457412 RepID=UPI003566A67B
MEANTLIRKVHMNCPLCDRTHEVEERKRTTSITLKGEEVTYEERFYFCANADEDENEFETGSMMNENLLNARNAYRVKKGLLTSDEIVAIRASYGLSQVDLAKLLGWGEATISRYESKAIQDEAYDTMLRLVKDNPLQALEFLKKNADKFSGSKRLEIRSKIVEKLDSYGKEFLTRQTFEGEYANFEEPSDSNGFAILNIDKIEAMISYIAEKVTNLFKVKLMKMLWYSDVLAFIENGSAMTGMVYRHEPMGALPIGHYSLMNLENLNVQEEMSYNYDTMLHIYPTASMDYSVLSDGEKAILDKVIEKFKNYKAKDIVDYMHEEKANAETAAGEIIPFSLAKEIRAF